MKPGLNARHLDRRTFLRGVGATMALPLLDAMTPAFASTPTENVPMRMAVSYAPNGVAMWKREPHQVDSDCTLDYFMDDVVIAGDPDHVTSQLLELREAIGPFGSLVLTAHDWDDRDRWIHSLELFAREVMPAFNKAIGVV